MLTCSSVLILIWGGWKNDISCSNVLGLTRPWLFDTNEILISVFKTFSEIVMHQHVSEYVNMIQALCHYLFLAILRPVVLEAENSQPLKRLFSLCLFFQTSLN